MKTLVKNFLTTFRRFKMAAFLNISGLAVAFAAFLIIMMQIDYERNFDRCHPDEECIFRIDRTRGEGDMFAAIIPRAFMDAVFASSPHITHASLLTLPQTPTYIQVGEGDERRGFREMFTLCYPDVIDVFGFVWTEGDGDCLKDPEKVVIPASMARRLFGNKPAVGQPIRAKDAVWGKDDGENFTVGGVYKDFPVNTQLNNAIYTTINKTGADDWYSQNYIGYVRLDSPESREDVEADFNRSFDFQQYNSPEGTRMDLIPLTDIYYYPHQFGSLVKVGNPSTIRLLLLIALLVIIVAGINFTNFSTSLAPLRIKSINTQKVLGSSSAGLRWALVTEAVGICLVACLVAFGLVGIFNQTGMLSFVEADTRLSVHLPLLFELLAIALGVGLIAGLYPAYYMTSFPPALVLKGSFGLSAKGRILRTALIGFQYVVSIGLIVGALFIRLQNDYIRSFDLGFDKDQIAIVEISRETARDARDLYVDRLKEYPGIEDVAFASSVVGGSDTYMMYGMNYKGQEFYPYVIPVSWNFLKVMGIPVVKGRDFVETDYKKDSVPVYIYTRSVWETMQLEAGQYLDGEKKYGGYIAGCAGDVKMISLRGRENTFDMAFLVNGRQPIPVSYIRLKAGTPVDEAVNHIRRTLMEIDPSYPFDIRFYDSVFDQLYQKEQYMKKMITLFSLLAIVLSIVGVFGLVVFETQYRRKEIGIRKVHGATVGQILRMFNRVYLRVVLICFVIAAPLGYWAVRKWLENFAYRTPMYWWVFVVALLVVATITLATVTFQNWRTANENPVNSLRTE